MRDKVIASFLEAIIVNRCIGCYPTQLLIFSIDKEPLSDLLGIIIERIKDIFQASKIIWMVKVNIGNDRIFWMIRHEMTLVFV